MGRWSIALLMGLAFDARAEESLSPVEITPEWMVFGALDGDQFGDSIAVAKVGDTPFAIAISAPHAAGGGTLRGCVYLYPITATGISEASQDLFCGEVDNAQLGLDLAWLGDVDGNAEGDLLIGARDAVYRIGVGINGFGDGPHVVQTFDNPSWPSISAAGDLNGDLLADFVVGDDATGTVSIYMNSTTEPDHVLMAPEEWSGGFGGKVLSGSDINADGTPDLVVLAGIESDVPGGGFVWFTRGGWFDEAPDWQLPTSVHMGAHGGLLKDVDGDELADLIVFDGGTGEGPSIIAQYRSSDIRYGETEPYAWFDLNPAPHESGLRSLAALQWDGSNTLDLMVGDTSMRGGDSGPSTGGFWSFAGFEDQPYDLWDGFLVTLGNHDSDDGRLEPHELGEVLVPYPRVDEPDGLLVGAPRLGMGDGQRKGAVFLVTHAAVTSNSDDVDPESGTDDTGDVSETDDESGGTGAKSDCGCATASGMQHWARTTVVLLAFARRRQ